MNPKVRRRLVIAVCILAAAFVFTFWILFRKRNQSPSAAKPAASVSPSSPGSASPAAKAAQAQTPTINSGEPTDFAAALEATRALGDPLRRSREFGRNFRLWLERDPEAALEYVRRLPATSREYTQGLLMALEMIAARDPERALALARELAVTREQLALYNSLFAQFAEQDLKSAVQRLTLVPPGAARENGIRALVDRWVRTDLPGALTWAQNLAVPSERTSALEGVLGELAAKDPLQAIELAQKSLNGPALERTVFNALQLLIASDPQSASGLVTLLPPGEMQTLAAGDVARALATQNVEAALTWAKTLSSDEVRRLATKQIFQIWGTSNPGAAGSYLITTMTGQEQHDAAISLAAVLATANPQSAIAWAQTLPVAETRSLALANIANAWAQRDPAAAAHWVAELPGGTLGTLAPRTLDATLSYWVLKDAGGAQEFVRTLPPAAQTSAAPSLAPLLSQNNPIGALTWAQTLATNEAREGALIGAYRRWQDNAPSAAQDWLASAQLPIELKKRMQSP